MSSNYKLQKYEAICLILIVMVSKLILNVPYYIIDLVGTGAIINLIHLRALPKLAISKIPKFRYY